MDSYPEDLLVGVFPLVFAVDAIHAATTSNSGGEDHTGANSKRTLFDRFLDAVAASLIDDEDDGADKRRSVSLFRSESEEDSDDEGLEDHHHSKKQRSPGIYPGFGRRTIPRNLSNDSMDSQNVASFAKALKHGQGFFQRARIESISAKYGFPPSKDPEGTDNLAYNLHQAMKNRNNRDQLPSLFDENPLDGILPAGWLEKHVHALPSVILVVCGVTSARPEQEEQDRLLYETIEHLRYSLVPKRKCTIQIIGLLQDDVSPLQGDVWSRTISSTLHEQEGSPPPSESTIYVTQLRASSDLQANDTGMPTSPALKRLHRTVRDASLAYYLGQARRTKEKLGKLQELKHGKRAQAPPPIQLMPLLIRYCFKIAMFYEFQWKHEKSIRYMSEGYRYVSKYYQYLVSERGDMDDLHDTDDQDHTLTPGGEESVEVALPTAIAWHKIVPVPPDDMLHQCRAVADWMNLKILSAGFVSHTESGLHAAAHQWRMHARVFCSRRHSLAKAPAWFEWSYIARQRLVMSQLVERHPPTAFGQLLGREHDEAVLTCSPWRLYESAAEAMLVLGREIAKADDTIAGDEKLTDESERTDPMRLRYVGGMGNEGLGPTLAEEKSVAHTEKALEYVQRAIDLFERELEREKRGFYAEDEFSEKSSSRAGARLFYVAGGILLGMGRHEEAVGKLTKAAKFSQGWQQLELAVRRMLIECYEKHIPSHSDTNENSDTLASMILDSYFNAKMSSTELRRALGHFLSITGGESLKWFHDTVDEEDASLPFSFAVSFLSRTHATAGDTVQASVVIRSNLDYAVHVNSAALLSLAGQLNIRLNDLLSASNASEGSEDGIIIQAKTAIVISTEVELPKDTSIIASDDSGNGGEQQGVAGKGSFAKSARPRSAGITAAGGARLVSEEKLEQGNQSSQGWNLNFLGGKPLRCDGLSLVFYPVQAEKASAEKVTLIELTIKKKKRRTAANIKRTPFEEENYIASSWSRPNYLPLCRGPCSLRVSGPMPHLTVTNLTGELTGGKAVEGTVNRVLLKLQTGPNSCSNMKMSISCFSILVTPSGSTKRLVPKDEVTPEAENAIDMTNPSFRAPLLVCPGEGQPAPCGYDLPNGWATAGSGHRQEDMPIPALKGRGDCSYVHLDIFRPAVSLLKEIDPSETAEPENVAESGLCKTDFYVTISYKQERPSTKKARPSRRRARRPMRRPPAMSKSSGDSHQPEATETEQEVEIKDSCDDVSLEYTGSVVWTKPLRATFVPGASNHCPSGSRHPANTVEEDSRGSDIEFALVDGEIVTSKCTLELDPAMEDLGVDVVSVGFKDGPDNEEEESPTDLVLKSGLEDDGLLLKTAHDDPTRKLYPGSKFSLSYAVEAKVRANFRRGGISSYLGVLDVEWVPRALTLPAEASSSSHSDVGAIQAHGPLVLVKPSKMQFRGPSFYIESAPLDAQLTSIPSSPSVASPFQVSYRIENKTKLHQHLTIRVDAPPLGNGLLLCGATSGELNLGPSEQRALVYTFLATHPGRVRLPPVQVASTRYGSWVIHDKMTNPEVYVFP